MKKSACAFSRGIVLASLVLSLAGDLRAEAPKPAPEKDELEFGVRKGDINRAAVHMSETLATHLRAAAVPPEVQLTIEEGAEHKGEAWAGRYAKDFVFLFGKRP